MTRFPPSPSVPPGSERACSPAPNVLKAWTRRKRFTSLLAASGSFHVFDEKQLSAMPGGIFVGLPADQKTVNIHLMSTITAILESDSDGTLHLPFFPALS